MGCKGGVVWGDFLGKVALAHTSIQSGKCMPRLLPWLKTNSEPNTPERVTSVGGWVHTSRITYNSRNSSSRISTKVTPTMVGDWRRTAALRSSSKGSPLIHPVTKTHLGLECSRNSGRTTLGCRVLGFRDSPQEHPRVIKPVLWIRKFPMSSLERGVLEVGQGLRARGLA